MRPNLDGAMLQTKQEEDGDYELDIVSGRVVAALQGNLQNGTLKERDQGEIHVELDEES